MNERGEWIECACDYMRYSNEPCDICPKIESAYHRGREDAAIAIYAELSKSATAEADRLAKIAAARGGEQE